jgi:hypothetical protein
MSDDAVSRNEHIDGSLPAPKPAVDHASFGVGVLPRPTQDRTEAGVLHPAHRAG